MTYVPTSEGPHPIGLGGVQKLYEFPNGYTASVVMCPVSYGGRYGKWEFAVKRDGELVTTDHTPDVVVGWLTDEQVEELLRLTEALKP